MRGLRPIWQRFNNLDLFTLLGLQLMSDDLATLQYPVAQENKKLLWLSEQEVTA